MAIRKPHRPGRSTALYARLRIESLEDRTLPAIITVTSAADGVTGADGQVTLREAILSTNGNADTGDDVKANRVGDYATGSSADTIIFAIPGGGIGTILPTSALPDVTDSLVIDGTTQSGWVVGRPVIELSGTFAGEASGLVLAAPSTVRGLVINGFSENGIDLFGSAGQSVIEGNFIGTDVTGTLARGNDDGIVIHHSPVNVIGGTTPAARNLISGNRRDGVSIGGLNAVGNVVMGNYIGTDVSGTHDLGNGRDGVLISEPEEAPHGTDPASFTTVGGNTAEARNVISGNGFDGVEIAFGTTHNRVLGNFIGTTADGSKALGNSHYGVGIYDATLNTIGGLTPSQGSGLGNVISGNEEEGIFIGRGEANRETSVNTVQGNLIGLGADGVTPVANEGHGVLIENASSNLIGGTADGARNVISANELSGVMILAVTASASSNRVQGNYIGTSKNGEFGTGVGNGETGVEIRLDSTDPAILASNNLIGGADAADGAADGAVKARNVISGNQVGVLITGERASNNLVQGNYIGTNAGGVVPAGNRDQGVFISGPNNLIGGTENGAGNVVSGNILAGIYLLGDDARRNRIQGNLIGTDHTGTAPLRNLAHGVLIDSANDNLLGGTDTGAGNTIAFNGSSPAFHGVVVASGTGNAIRRNSIFGNRGRGIDLVSPAEPDTVTLNDASGDPDDGANGLQDYPVIISVTPQGAVNKVTWALNSAPNTAFLIEFFADSEADPSGFGEGRRYLATTTVITDASGDATFVTVFPAADKFISATSTDPSGNTSEFSMVDTDGDALADAWETWGIDLDEDGVVDLTLDGANPEKKDLYVEVDAMLFVAPTQADLDRVATAFANAPVPNPNGTTGITLHAKLDEILPLVPWTYDFDGDGVDALGGDRNANGKLDAGEFWDLDDPTKPFPGDPDEQDGWVYFDATKNGFFGGGFGTPAQRASATVLAAKRLAFRYAIFADRQVVPGKNGGSEVGTSGRAEIGGNDLMVTMGAWGNIGTDQKTGTFMHEFGHALQLRHGGADDVHFKPNYHSVMNYIWQVPASWMLQDPNGNTVSHPGPWVLDFSERAFNTLDERDKLDENAGIGGHFGHWAAAGPPAAGRNVWESGPVNWNADSDSTDTGVRADVNRDGHFSVLLGHDDWSNVRFYFRESKDFADGAQRQDDSEEMTLDVFDQLNTQGDSPGVLNARLSEERVYEDAGVVTVTVVRSGGTQGTVTVDYATSGGTATAGEDYVATSGTLTFAEGEYRKTFDVVLLNDSLHEPTESIRVLLSNVTGGALVPDSDQTLDLLNGNAPGRPPFRGALEFDVSHTAVSEDAGLVTVAVTRRGGTGGTITVDYATADGTATAGTDYLPASGTLTFADGEDRKTFTVQINNDTAGEYEESVLLALSSPTGGGILGPNAVASLNIRDEDAVAFVVTNVHDAGRGSLRQAILEANIHPGLDFIRFSIGAGVKTIAPLTVLPTVTDTVDIDGTTQPGFAGRPIIELVGSALKSGIGLQLGIGADNSVVRGLVINRFNQTGIGVAADHVRVVGNYVGTDVTGLLGAIPGLVTPYGNRNGITIGASANGVVVGGTTPVARNVISGNLESGIFAQGGGHRVEGNLIGVGADGVTRLANRDGVSILNAPDNVIGGAAPAARNVISGNGGYGVLIQGTGATGNRVEGNYVGTNAAGTAAVGNGVGIGIQNAPNNTICSNVISGNGGSAGSGVRVAGPASGTLIVGNFIGTTVTGHAALPNGHGVHIEDTSHVTVGGTTPDARNVISGNVGVGIQVGMDVGPQSNGNLIRGNFIGVAADGVNPLGNGDAGVILRRTAGNVIVGGLEPDAANVIAFNLYGIRGGATVLSNSIHSNTHLGHSRGFGYKGWAWINHTHLPTNPGLNYPVLSSAMSADGRITISGHLNSLANETFLLQFFSNREVDLSGFGEGETLLGSGNVMTDAAGRAEFTFTFAATVPDRHLVTANATRLLTGGTTEFSRRLAVGDALGSVYTVNTTDDVDDGVADAAHTSLREAIHAANNHSGLDTIRFNIGSGAKTIAPRIIALPAVTDPVFIDGTTQPGFAGTPIIELSGTSLDRNHPSAGNPSGLAGERFAGLRIFANNSTVRGLVINRFDDGLITGGGGSALWVEGNDNVIEGNFLGTNVTGTQALPNSYGLRLDGARNRIGGTTPLARNVLSGNRAHGIIAGSTVEFGITAPGVPPTFENTFLGNFVGTDVTGTKALGNGELGTTAAQVNGAFNVIGGAAPGAGNLISGNFFDGLGGGFGNIVQGNFVGTDVTGTQMLGNGRAGILAGNQTLVGGTEPGERNLVSNNRVGIRALGNGVIQGNHIGTDVTGTKDFGNREDGVVVEAIGTRVGGIEAGAGNLISGNDRYGIFLSPFSAAITVQGNRIGLQSDGKSPLGNGSDGIAVGVGSASTTRTDHLIGGLSDGAGNVIAFNGGHGVNVASGRRNTVLSNLIFTNGNLAIDLNADGPTPNDPLDADDGDNELQNFPVLTRGVTDGARTLLDGTLHSAPNTTFLVQLFASPQADPSGFGEGQTLIGSASVTVDSGGNGSFALVLPAAVPAGHFITATATDPVGNTSEFSRAVAIVSGLVDVNRPPAAHPGGPYAIDEGSPLTLNAASSDPDGDPLTYSWDVNGDGLFGDANGVSPIVSWPQLRALGVTDGPSSFGVRLRVNDGQGHEVTSDPATLTVRNVAPAVSAGPSRTVNEGDLVTLDGGFADPGSDDTHAFRWTVAAENGQVFADGNERTFEFAPPDNGNYAVTFTVTDDDGGVGTDTAIVTVNNVNPVIDMLSASPALEDGEVTLAGIYYDAGTADTHTLSINWGDGSAPQTVVVAGGTFRVTHHYLDDNTTGTALDAYTISVVLNDDDGGSAARSTTTTITNVAPTGLVLNGGTISEDGTFILTGRFADPGTQDTHTVTINWGDGAAVTVLTLAAGVLTFSADHQYLDDDPTVTPSDVYAVSVTVADDDTGNAAASASVTVNNVAPTAAIVGAPTSSPEGTEITLGSSVADVGSLDTHAYSWSVTKNGAAYAFGIGTGINFTPDDNGTYVVTLVVTDDDGGSATDTEMMSVTNVNPTATNNGQQSPRQYSDFIIPVTVTATDPSLVDTLTAEVVSGPANSGISLTWDPATRSGQLTGKADLAPGNYTFVIRVTDDDGGTSLTNVVVNVTPEDAAVTYAGVLFAATPTGNTDTATVSLISTIQDISAVSPGSDPDAGDITRATVRFLIYDGNNTRLLLGQTGPLPVTLVGPLTGRVSTDYTFDIGNADSREFLIRTVVEGYYHRDAATDDVMLTVVRAQPNSISGGGYLVNEASFGTYAGATGAKTNFGFNVKFNQNLTNIQGRVNVIVRGADGRVYQIKSTALDSLAVPPRVTEADPALATFTGKANIQDITNPLAPVTLVGNGKMQLTLTDMGEPGSADTIGLSIWNSQGTQVLFSSRWTGTKTNEQLLGGGNLQVRATNSSKPLKAFGGAVEGEAAGALTDEELGPILAEAIRRWAEAGLDADRLAVLGAVQVHTADLTGPYLGFAFLRSNTIHIDTDAAGYGWFIDSTPGDDSEFLLPGDQGEVGRMDLLSTVVHELGHVIGLDDLHGAEHANNAMGEALVAGTRRVPAIGELSNLPHEKRLDFSSAQRMPNRISPAIVWLAPLGDLTPAKKRDAETGSMRWTSYPVMQNFEHEPKADRTDESETWPLLPLPEVEAITVSVWDEAGPSDAAPNRATAGARRRVGPRQWVIDEQRYTVGDGCVAGVGVSLRQREHRPHAARLSRERQSAAPGNDPVEAYRCGSACSDQIWE